MTQDDYDQHKETLAAGKIVISGGRTAASLAELDMIREIEKSGNLGNVIANEGNILRVAPTPPARLGTYGEVPPFPGDGRVMAIHSGRLTPEQIQELGPDDPLIVAAHHLTAEELDALVDSIAAKQDGEKAGGEGGLPDALDQKETPDESAPADALGLTVKASIVSGAGDNVTPKTALDNKTSRAEPAGKNASKADGDAAQSQEQAGAETAIG